jgi:hypothetical protein
VVAICFLSGHLSLDKVGILTNMVTGITDSRLCYRQKESQCQHACSINSTYMSSVVSAGSISPRELPISAMLRLAILSRNPCSRLRSTMGWDSNLYVLSS